ncbi:MAG: sodium:solute symporter [Cyanobacteria bacterium SZAS LIN-2]|nr:sodium:solute symporter [Cyanobacteria bacterium SZAS LIN-3]MBS1996476.1 sodium:solute symporter [Cyanobacteria bacterium SZAS LIN-2]
MDMAAGVDLAVVLLYFAVIIFVGLRFGQKEDNLEDFSLGGRSMPWFAVLASIIAAETSAATFLGTPGEGFGLVSYTYLQIAVGTVIGRVIVAYLFIKPFFDLNVYSIYEYLQVRFGKGTRLMASATFLVTRVLASGARLYVSAILLAVAYALITGESPTTAQQLIVYLAAIVTVTVITAIYTSVGGIKAVVWTDCIQAAVMFGGAIAAIAVLIGQMPGGWHAVLAYYQQTPMPFFVAGTVSGAPLVDNIRTVLTSEYTVWAALFAATFTTLATHGTDQDMVQRMLTASDYKKSRLSLICSGLADLPIGFIFLTIGILMHQYYALLPDAHLPHKNSEIFAYFILTRMPVGLRGLLIAGIFATAMGSLSAALNALATSATRDFCPETDGAHSVQSARRFTFIFAGLMIVVACATSYFVIEHPQSRIIPIVLGIFGYTYGSLLGVFLLGLLTKKRGSDRGNLIAMLAGAVLVISLPQLAFIWRIMFGSLTTLAVGLMFRRPEEDIIVTG